MNITRMQRSTRVRLLVAITAIIRVLRFPVDPIMVIMIFLVADTPTKTISAGVDNTRAVFKVFGAAAHSMLVVSDRITGVVDNAIPRNKRRIPVVVNFLATYLAMRIDRLVRCRKRHITHRRPCKHVSLTRK